MLHIDHVCIACQNFYEAADRWRRRTNLSTYDAGWFKAGMAVRIIPLGNYQYIELESVIDVKRAAGNPIAEHFSDVTKDGADYIIGWCLRVDTLDELRSICERLGVEAPDAPVSARILPDGTTLQVYGAPNSIDVWPKGLPNFLYWPETTKHPGHHDADHWVQPTKIGWMEIGGDEKAIRDWIGEGVDALPLRFVGGEPGIRAVGVETVLGEAVFQP